MGLSSIFSLIGIEYYKLKIKWNDLLARQSDVLSPYNRKYVFKRAALERKLKSCQQKIKLSNTF